MCVILYNPEVSNSGRYLTQMLNSPAVLKMYPCYTQIDPQPFSRRKSDANKDV